MPSDIRQPADDSRLHDDLAELARLEQSAANTYWLQMGDLPKFSPQWYAAARKHERHEDRAQHYRRLAARGETVPRF